MKVQVLKNIASANDAIAAQNRQLFDIHRILTVNLMSSPGSGKTSIILQTTKHAAKKLNLAVIEGDVASRVDADKIGKQGIPVVQINTDGGCSLQANMVENALSKLPLQKTDVLIIENVGNLICPAGFDLGEHRRVIISSIPEGDDKPLKYPIIFTDADAVIINKMDLLPHFDFNLLRFRRRVKGLNPRVKFFQVSCKTGEGIAEWYNWLSRQTRDKQNVKIKTSR